MGSTTNVGTLEMASRPALKDSSPTKRMLGYLEEKKLRMSSSDAWSVSVTMSAAR